MKESTYGRAMLNFSPNSRADIVNGLRDSQAPNQNVMPVNLLNVSAPFELVGRQAQFQRITQVLAGDGDLLIVGVPGSGRRTLVRRAAQEVGAQILEVDCIRVTDGQRFVQLLCESIDQTFQSAAARSLMQEWIEGKACGLFVLKDEATGRQRLKPVRADSQEQQWRAFEVLLHLLQQLAESSGKRVVLILESFPHIRSWDRNGMWETFLRNEIQRQTEVSYVLIATIAEISIHLDEPGNNLEIVQLAPLADDVVAAWVQEVLHTEGLTFDPRSPCRAAPEEHRNYAGALYHREIEQCLTSFESKAEDEAPPRKGKKRKKPKGHDLH